MKSCTTSFKDNYKKNQDTEKFIDIPLTKKYSLSSETKLNTKKSEVTKFTR